MSELITIPIFPLPNVVFFPRTFLPLHIFEPRYREMIKDALNGDRYIGMNLLQEGWEKDYYGNPPVYPVGCMGKIVEVQTLEDGRYNIILFGLTKFIIKKQIFTKSYRQAQIEYTHPEKSITESLPLHIKEMLNTTLSLYAKHTGDQGEIESLLESMEDDTYLVNTLSFSLNFTTLEKQYLLEAAALTEHCKKLIDLLQFQLHNQPSWVAPLIGSHRKN